MAIENFIEILAQNIYISSKFPPTYGLLRFSKNSAVVPETKDVLIEYTIVRSSLYLILQCI